MSKLSNIKQQNVLIRVDYYDQAEKAKFANYPAEARDAVEKVAGTTISVPTATFLTFYLFQAMRQGVYGLSTVEDLKENYREAEGLIGRSLFFDGQGVRLPDSADPKNAPAGVIETLGEAVGLSVANEIHGLTEADWQRLPEPVHAKTRAKMRGLDFHHAASSGISEIQLETKGAAVDDNSHKTGLSGRVQSIRDKKTAVRKPVDGSTDNSPAAVRYGTIAAIDAIPGNTVQAWLVDPPSEPSPWTPHEFKALAKVQFLAQLFAYVVPRSPLTTALVNRARALVQVTNPFSLSGVDLRHGDGRPFKYDPQGVDNTHSSLFFEKARVLDMPVGGTAFEMGERTIGFLGFQQELIDLVINQELDAIADYRAAPSSAERAVNFSFAESRLGESSLALLAGVGVRPVLGRLNFSTSGTLHANRSGMVFGFFDLE